MKFIQLGNLDQCESNGLSSNAVYEFGKVIGFISKDRGNCDAHHLSARESGGNGRMDWASTFKDRTPFILEIKMRR